MHLELIIKLLVLLLMANGTPVILKRVMGGTLARPLDFGVCLPDGRPVFGRSKTWRGILGALIVTTIAARLIGLDWTIGLVIAGFAMIGDLASSFTKRRLGLASGGMAVGLDQIPESLLPFLAVRGDIALSWLDIALGVAAFFVGSLVLSKILFRLGVREQPH